MISDVHQTLYDFWSQFTYAGQPIDAYLTGHVPDEKLTNVPTVYPYITFDVGSAQATGKTTLVGIVWFKATSGLNVNLNRAEVLDQIAEAVPEGGVKLPCGDGFITLHRNSAGFQSYYDDPEDESVVGGRTSLEAGFYLI